MLAGVAAVALATTLATATVAQATPPNGETTTPVGRGALAQPANVNLNLPGGHATLQTKGALDAMMVELSLAPSATGGWHKHAGPHITIVKQGTLTIFDAKCKRHDVPAGMAFVSPGSSPTKDINNGTTPVVFDVVFLLPHNVLSPRVDQPAPAGCNA
jgi:quercetin dioxygenase-like cupin family protein